MKRDKLPTAQPKLTKKQEAFISNLIDNGGDIKQAAISAGYTVNSAQTIGYDNLRLTHVQQAYQALIASKLAAGKALSLKVLEEVARTSDSDNARVTAADSYWKKAMELEGLGKPSSAGITINIGVRGDIGATQTIDVTPQHTEDVGVIDAKSGDSESD